MSLATALEQAVLLAAFGPPVERPPVFRCRIHARYHAGHLLRFFVFRDGRVEVIGCHPDLLLSCAAGSA